MAALAHWMNVMNGIVWGPAMIMLLVGTGIYLTIRLRFVQLRYFDHAVKCVSGTYDAPDEEGDIRPAEALAAALSATIGTGNIAGVATAIALGGPGAVFWMWMTALVGMATKFTSCSLAVRYRTLHEDGSVSGGPMYYMARGLGWPWLGTLFALFAGLASFGIGCAVQSNSVVDVLLSLAPQSLQETRIPLSMPVVGGTAVAKLALGVLLALLAGGVIIGGIRRIAHVASRIVPFMCALYVLGALAVLIRCAGALPEAFGQIFRFAFTPVAMGGGMAGVVLQRTMQKGIARGVFSNESGMGSAPMVYAASKTHEMIRGGFVAMLGPFVDTLVVCTMTALVIIATGAWQVRAEAGTHLPDGEPVEEGTMLYGPHGLGLPMRAEVMGKIEQVVGTVEEPPRPFLTEDGAYYQVPTGASLTAAAFGQGIGHTGSMIVALGIMLFAYSTLISYSYYGERCWEYLLGEWVITPYRVVFCAFIVFGTISGLDLIWLIADNLNALMAVPNLIALLALAGVVVREKKSYLARMDEQGEL